MTLIYGSSSQNSEEPPTTSSRSACTENHSNSTEDNPLHLVAASHRFKTVACPFSAEDDGFPRHIACADSNMDLVQKLIDNGTNFDMKDEHGNTARHIACADDNMDIVQKLLKRGTDFDMKDESGDTSLHVACLKGRTNIVKELLKSNANVDVTSRITKHHCISHVGMVIRMLLKYSSTVAQILTRKKYWRHIAACRMF
jgi:ankyrin repeat protein